MVKSILVLAVLALTATGWQQKHLSGAPVRLKEERMILEYSATNHEAAVLVEAESEESLENIEVRDLQGTLLFDLRAEAGLDLALSGFSVESKEFSSTAIFDNYPAGTYELRARTVDGRQARGQAVFSHALPRAPIILYPAEGAHGVPTDLRVRWTSVPEAVGYQVSLEQGESDGLAVQLSAGRNNLEIPDGVLAPGTETHVEVGAIGANGNRTLVEAVFTTR